MYKPEKKSNEKFWLKLDNAAKIFPGQNKSKWSNIFRFALVLTEKIDPALLEQALQDVLPRFPCFDVRIRRGIFWYYFEKNAYQNPPVMPDIKNPCHRVKFNENRYFLFRVYYHENRIAVDFFHALTDGYGASVFVSTLAAQYLRLTGKEIDSGGSVLDLKEQPAESELEDAFERFANSKVKAKRADSFVYHRKGEKMPAHNVNVTTGYIPLDKLLETARSHSATVTEYLASILLYVHYKRQLAEERKQKDVSVQIPVNLRRQYDTKTLRNFSLCYSVRIDPNLGEYTFEEILKQVSLYLRYVNNQKQLNAMMTANMGLERNPIMRAIPLFIKDLGIGISFLITGEQTTTALLTNLGPVHLPKNMEPFVRHAMFMAGPGVLNGARLGAVSCKDVFAITFANIYKNSDIEQDFFTALVQRGLPVKIESNRD